MTEASDEARADESAHPLSDLTGPVATQRIESVAIAIVVLVATIVLYPAHWWMPFALFLVFDLSALGYLRSPRTGAVWYNLVHSYTLPALLGVAAVVALLGSPTPFLWWSGIIALSWAFHIAVDRALGYGLKLPDAFTHTHLGRIGKDRAR